MAAKLVTVLLILEVGFISNIIAGHPSGKSRRQDNEQDSDDHEDSMQTGCTLNKLLNCKTQLNITCEDLGGSNSSKHGAEIWESLLSNKTDSNVSMIDTELMYIGEHGTNVLCSDRKYVYNHNQHYLFCRLFNGQKS